MYKRPGLRRARSAARGEVSAARVAETGDAEVVGAASTARAAESKASALMRRRSLERARDDRREGILGVVRVVRVRVRRGTRARVFARERKHASPTTFRVGMGRLDWRLDWANQRFRSERARSRRGARENGFPLGRNDEKSRDRQDGVLRP